MSSDQAIIQVSRSKTIQFGERVLQVPLVKVDRISLCPIRALQRHIARHHPHYGFSLFCYSTYGQVHTFTYQNFMAWIKRFAQASDLNPVDYGAQSFRRGGATFAFQTGIAVDTIKAMGDWSSDAYSRYLDLSLDHKLLAASAMARSVALL